MKRVFVDTSGIMAMLVANDGFHRQAKNTFKRLAQDGVALVTSSYILVETYTLLGRRLGLEAVQTFRSEFAPVFDVVWVDQDLHDAGLDLLAREGRRDLSLVDATSFVIMRRQRIDDAFTYDSHFSEAGFAQVA